MKSFAKLFLQMYLHYSTQMMDSLSFSSASSSSVSTHPRTSSSLNPAAASFSSQNSSASVNPPSVPFNRLGFNNAATDKIMKLENRLLNSATIEASSKQNSRNKSTGELHNTEFEGFLLFFSKFLNYSNHHLFYYHIIQSSLQEIEQLLQSRTGNSLVSTSAGHQLLQYQQQHHFQEQFSEIGVLSDNEKHALLLMKIMKLGQMIGYLYFSDELEEEMIHFSSTHATMPRNENTSNDPPSPTPAVGGSSFYFYKHVIPLKTILEKNLKEKTIYFTILWILSFLKMMKPLYYQSSATIQQQQMGNHLFLFNQFKDLLVLLYTIQHNEKFFPAIGHINSVE
jgi:hypothetical protein